MRSRTNHAAQAHPEFRLPAGAFEGLDLVRASENLSALLGIEARDATGQPVADLIDGEVLHDIRNRTIVLRAHRGSERLYGVRLLGNDILFDLAVHDATDLLVLKDESSGPNETIRCWPTWHGIPSFARRCGRRFVNN